MFKKSLKTLFKISFILNFWIISPIYALDFGTYERPFAADSLWNSRPISPTFSNIVIPNSLYNPTAHTPEFSSTCYLTTKNDSPVTIKIGPGYGGVHDRDSEKLVSELVIPHWPEGVLPATGADAHADIFDVDNNIIHSFYRLKKVNDQWTSLLYAWSPLDGRGWGDPAHFYQGGRAVGVTACAGMIRKHEVNDGDTMFRHALAMSLADNGIAKGYVFPATSDDYDTSKNTGQIPEGALLMLPPSFNADAIQTPLIRKIANTLKRYGAYIVDKNYGTPYVIFSEIGARTFTGSNISWYEYRLIQSSLRMVNSTQGWVDGNGTTFQPSKNLNILSMRGPWSRGYNYLPDSEKCEASCNKLGEFDSYSQSLVFEPTSEPIIQSNSSGRSVSTVDWAKPKKGVKYQLIAKTTGDAKLRFVIRNPQKNDYVVYDSFNLVNGQKVTFTWPLDDYDITVVATSGLEASSVSGELIRVE